MFVATFVFLGLAAIAAVALSCSPRKRPAEADNPRVGQEKKQEGKLAWDANATWQDIKTAWLEQCVRREEGATPRHVIVSSWGRTFALCAALCLIGVVLETQYNRRLSIANIVNSLCHQRSASAASHTSQFRPH
jgi:hypothetical protein